METADALECVSKVFKLALIFSSLSNPAREKENQNGERQVRLQSLDLPRFPPVRRIKIHCEPGTRAGNGFNFNF